MIKKIRYGSCAVAALALFAGNALAEEGTTSKLDNMISPITNPINFEDPRITTELRPIYAYHDLNDDFVTSGGEVQVWAAQARIAITDRLGFIATKDGFLRLQADEVLDDSEGALNLEGGLKYAAYVDEDAGQIVSVGLKYTADTGSPKVFEGTGEGAVIPFISGATEVGGFNLMGSTELRVALDEDKDSTFWDMSLHADYPIENFYPTLELNLFHVAEAGDRLPLPGEGADVLNLGASEADGDTTVNLAVGLRYRLCKNVDAGIGFEFPLTDEDDVFGERLLVDLVIKAPDWTLL